MKKSILILALVLGITTISFSQKTIEEKIETNGQETTMKFSFADDIILEAWNNNYIELKVIVNINYNKYNEHYKLDIDKNGGTVNIVEHVDFDKIKKLKGDNDHCNFNTDLNYSLKVPKNQKIKLETISGEVELIGCQGEMAIKSISGFIDYSVPQNHEAKINLSTVTGDVYSNVKFDENENKKISWVGTKEVLSLNGGNTGVKLETVSGDIYLRKF